MTYDDCSQLTRVYYIYSKQVTSQLNHAKLVNIAHWLAMFTNFSLMQVQLVYHSNIYYLWFAVL